MAEKKQNKARDVEAKSSAEKSASDAEKVESTAPSESKVEQTKPESEKAAPEPAARQPVTEPLTSPKPQAATPVASQKPPSNRLAVFAFLLAVISLVLMLFISYHLYQRGHAASTDINELETRTLTQQVMLEKMQPLNELPNQLGAAQTDWQTQFERQSVEMDRLSNSLLTLASRHPSDWLLAETNYLVRLAGHKLWLEHDITTSLMLLREADGRLAELADPSLTKVRKALADDMAALKALPNVDRSHIALSLNALAGQVDQLALKSVILPDIDQELDDNKPSSSTDDWRDNLAKTWRSFADDFITVRRRSSEVEPLLAPDQRWYLQENLRAKLMLAQLALFREQQGVYESAIDTASQWIDNFFKTENANTQAMLKSLKELKQHQIEPVYPDDFKVRAPLERLLERRLSALLTPTKKEKTEPEQPVAAAEEPVKPQESGPVEEVPPAELEQPKENQPEQVEEPQEQAPQVPEEGGL
ncbi:uroporphyrinogen-III C-methyltransferase [Corallincola platygyrae]|uniref:Uroporphyrinogen-III C-methyltransferase n=1 Tax=Corallincola platygyrae TaxID=1193278 RepID=A0ABW4XMG9_9GAMM